MDSTRIKFLKWRDDRWLSRSGYVLRYDKAEHFLRDMIISVLFGMVVAVLFNLVWEWVDGTRPWAEGKGVEGFSFKDFIAGLLGAGLGFGLRWWLA